MKTIILIPIVIVLGACASSSESGSGERSKGMQVTAGAANTIDCPSRNSTCYADVRRMCGERGMEEVDVLGSGRVSMAGRSGSGDDPFARADRQRNSNRPVSLRCKTPRTKSE